MRTTRRHIEQGVLPVRRPKDGLGCAATAERLNHVPAQERLEVRASTSQAVQLPVIGEYRPFVHSCMHGVKAPTWPADARRRWIPPAEPQYSSDRSSASGGAPALPPAA